MLSAPEIASKIPELTAADKAFPAGPDITRVYDELSEMAMEWWQKAHHETWAVTVFNHLFYGGGPNGGYELHANTKLEGVTLEDIGRVYEWFMAAKGSYYPKHEHKEALCSLLLATFFLKPEGV